MGKHSVAQHPIRKRSFQLFELVISLALITLCFFPLMKPHSVMRKKDREYLNLVQLEQASQKAYCDLKEILYENRHYSWDDLSDKISGELPDPFVIVTGRGTTREYRCTYTLQKRGVTTKPSLKKAGMVLDITLTFAPDHHFYRTLYLEKEVS